MGSKDLGSCKFRDTAKMAVCGVVAICTFWLRKSWDCGEIGLGKSFEKRRQVIEKTGLREDGWISHGLSSQEKKKGMRETLGKEIDMDTDTLR